MITLLSGRPGAGKSYEAVKFHILPSLAEGRKVVTNIPINHQHVFEVYGKEACDSLIHVKTEFGAYGTKRPFSEPDDFKKHDYKSLEGVGTLFVIDEAHLSMGVRADAALLEYLSMHRHYGHDIILVTQSHRKLHRDVRDMIEVTWSCVKKTIFGDDDGYIKKTFHGVPANRADAVKIEERVYESPIFKFYKSHTQSTGTVAEQTTKDSKGEKTPYKKLSIVMVVLGVTFSFYFGYKILSPKKAPQETTQQLKLEVVEPDAVIAESSTTQPKQAASAQPVVQSSSKSPTVHSKNAEPSNTKKLHPFYKVDLQVAGFGEYFDQTGRLVLRIYFDASQNGQYVFQVNDVDLIKAGYDVQVLGECAVKISYFDYEDFLTCNQAQTSGKVAKNSSF